MRQDEEMPFIGSSVKSNFPLELVKVAGGRPTIDFHWKKTGSKRRLIGNPNNPTRRLHKLFLQYLQAGIRNMQNESFCLKRLPSSTAFVKKSNPLKNAEIHLKGKFFYILDIKDAYTSLNLKKLALLIVYIINNNVYGTEFSLRGLGRNQNYQERLRNDPVYFNTISFLESFCSGIRGEGIAVGGPVSPYLFNLYCEVFIDIHLRKLCEKYKMTYTRYADDLVFSREKLVSSELRREIRDCIKHADFQINHRKSKVLSREMGTIFVTKVGLREPEKQGSSRSIIVFPQKKRRKLHGLIGNYLKAGMVKPELVSGYIAEFLHYFKNVTVKTATDKKTFALCREFKTARASTSSNH